MLLVHDNWRKCGRGENTDGVSPAISIRIPIRIRCRGWENRRQTGAWRSFGIDLFLSEQMDTSTPAGKIVFTVLGAVAELERSLIVERVRAGLAEITYSPSPSTRPSTMAGKNQQDSVMRFGCEMGSKRDCPCLIVGADDAARRAGEGDVGEGLTGGESVQGLLEEQQRLWTGRGGSLNY